MLTHVPIQPPQEVTLSGCCGAIVNHDAISSCMPLARSFYRSLGKEKLPRPGLSCLPRTGEGMIMYWEHRFVHFRPWYHRCLVLCSIGGCILLSFGSSTGAVCTSSLLLRLLLTAPRLCLLRRLAVELLLELRHAGIHVVIVQNLRVPARQLVSHSFFVSARL